MHKKILIAIFAVFFIGLPVLTLIFMPKEAKAFSEDENRYLAAFPTLSWKNIQNKSFMEGFDDWISDRFFAREDWIVAKNTVERCTGKQEINTVFTVNDQMMQKWSVKDEAQTRKSITAINQFAVNHTDSHCYMMLAPTSQGIYEDQVPKYADISSESEYIQQVYDALEGVQGIDVFSSLKDQQSDYIYYRTDHHWTSLGAYIAYQKAGDIIGWDTPALSDYSVEHASDSFRGTLYSKTLDKNVTPDVLDIYTKKENSPKVKVTITEGTEETTYDSMYFRDYLEKKDKYSVFLGLNEPMVTIENPSAKTNKELLVIKDSYANCMIPFLTENYEKITMIDLRYMNNLSAVDEEKYDDILFLYNVITFSEDSNFVKLYIQ